MKKFLIVVIVVVLIVFFTIFLRKNYFASRFLPASVDLVDLPTAIFPKPTTLDSNGLPSSHLIKTTFVPQSPEKNWDQPWQDACEEAALLTVNYYYKQSSPSISQFLNDYQILFQTENELGFSHDINLSQMAVVADEVFNYKSEIINEPTIEIIKDYISKDIPIIVPANGKILYQENKHFNSGGPWYHNLVILGYDDSRRQFIVHDVGTRHGAYFHYSYELLMDSIHDFPDSGRKEDIDSGAKNILVLLK